WHGDNNVGVGRLFDGQAATHLVTRLIDRLAIDKRIRTREINVFEQTHRVPVLRKRMRRTQTVLIDHNHLARFDVAYILSIDQIKCAGFRRYYPGIAKATESQWSESTAVSNC